MLRRSSVLAALLAASLSCDRRDVPNAHQDPNENVRRLMNDAAAQHGRSLNSMSPETVGTLSPRIHVGMTEAELNRVLAEKTSADPRTGKHIGTIVFGRGIVWLQDKDGKPLHDEKGELRADPDTWYCVLHLQDGNLKVLLNKEDRVISWSVEPMPQK
jgi:hypothetical protein